MPTPVNKSVHEAHGIHSVVINLNNPFDEGVVSDCHVDVTLRWASTHQYLSHCYRRGNVIERVSAVLLEPVDFETRPTESWRCKLRINAVGFPEFILAFYHELVQRCQTRSLNSRSYHVLWESESLLSHSTLHSMCSRANLWKYETKALKEYDLYDLFFVVEAVAITRKDHTDYPLKDLYRKVALSAIATR